MQAAKIGLVIGALFLASAAQAQTANSPTGNTPPANFQAGSAKASPTGGPLKATTGSNMPAPGLSGRHANTNTGSSATTGSDGATASAAGKTKSSQHAMTSASTAGKMPAP
jgi:hypothetical protein